MSRTREWIQWHSTAPAKGKRNLRLAVVYYNPGFAAKES